MGGNETKHFLKSRMHAGFYHNAYHNSTTVIKSPVASRTNRGEMIVLLQDDDVLKPDHSWYMIAAALFAKDSKLGVLGGYSGEIHAGHDMGRFTR